MRQRHVQGKMLIGQMASGSDGDGKSVKPDEEHFHKYWFDVIPGSQPSDAMFMPFGLEPEDPEDGTAYDDVLTDYTQSVGHRFGTLFYRDRVAKYLAYGFQLVADGEKEIERVGDIGKVVTWSRSTRKGCRLQYERATLDSPIQDRHPIRFLSPLGSFDSLSAVQCDWV